jgi:hypothetical protein
MMDLLLRWMITPTRAERELARDRELLRLREREVAALEQIARQTTEKK